MVTTNKKRSKKETPTSADKDRTSTKYRKKTQDNNDIPSPGAKKSSGFDEIESLFADKKKKEKEAAKRPPPQKGSGKHGQKGLLRAKANTTTSPQGWVDDGLGGKFNKEGFTGRVEDGMKIFKTHLLQSEKSGTTPQCPFDCDCCFI